MSKITQDEMSAVVQRMIANRPSDLAKSALMKAAHNRMVEARKLAAVYDGDLDRARPAYHVGGGWYGILDDLVKEFAEIKNLGFLAAHEKWGELRVAYLYHGDRNADVNAIEMRAHDRCLVTCWHCGQPGKMKQERWRRVRCDEHWSSE
ncbi:hypothetical protein [Agrobacterium tumefaciens]|uniref:hypothetical protein n=1 Tax=Agrobacterium tumefaciens TaxID=358 RepID=UPI0005543840|nr:hypothetical protein [Agrobacterium tumefaciens]